MFSGSAQKDVFVVESAWGGSVLQVGYCYVSVSGSLCPVNAYKKDA